MDCEIGTCGMAIDYCIMKKGMSILRGRESVPGISSGERENGKKEPGLKEYFDLWDSCMIKSLKLPKSGNQLRFLMQRVPSGRTSNALSIPRKFSALMFSSLIAST
nr:hypothetical protein [Tanacetum cinerariifolium]